MDPITILFAVLCGVGVAATGGAANAGSKDTAKDSSKSHTKFGGRESSFVSDFEPVLPKPLMELDMPVRPPAPAYDFLHPTPVERYGAAIAGGDYCGAAFCRGDAIRQLAQGPAHQGESAQVEYQAQFQKMVNPGAPEALTYEIAKARW